MKTNDELTSGEIGVVTYVFILYLYDTVYIRLNVSNLRCDPSIYMIIFNETCLSKRATILNQNKY